ncbi:MAG: hypothetical protein U0136_12045 [Bdellovibrionota bacterium]
MIDPAAEAALKAFEKHWQRYLSVAPFYRLDYTWPSVGVIDHLTFPLRSRNDLSPFERSIIHGAAAYLAVMAQRCWETFGVSSNVELHQKEIILRAVSGPGLQGTEAVAYVEADLSRMLAELPNPFQILTTFKRMIPTNENFVSQFAFGLFVGLLPTIEGPWSKENPQSWATQLNSVVKYLAQGTADNYAAIFLDEQLGQVAEVYYSELIFPLTMMQEELPIRRAVYSLKGTVETYKISPSQLSRMAANLMLSPDERIAQTAFCCAAALGEFPCSPELRASAASIGTTLGLLRHAMRDVRQAILKESDWIGKAEYSDADIQQIEKELQLHFFPWLKMSKQKILGGAGDEALTRLLRALADYNMKTATMIVDELVDLAPDDMDFRLQKVYLLLLDGKVQESADSLRTLVTEPESEDKPLIFDLNANVQLVLGNLQGAEQNFKKARNFATSDKQVKSDVANNYGWMLMLKGDFPTALELIDESLSLTPDSLVSLLNKTTILQQMGREHEAAAIDKRLLALAPFNREVFRGLVFDPGSKS